VVFRILADATVVLHLLFVLFVVLGGILVARWRWIAWAHVPAAIWGAWVEFAGWQCPLTPLENWFRQQGSGVTYKNEFRRTLPASDSLPALTFARGSMDIGCACTLVECGRVYSDLSPSRSTVTRSGELVFCYEPN